MTTMMANGGRGDAGTGATAGVLIASRAAAHDDDGENPGKYRPFYEKNRTRDLLHVAGREPAAGGLSSSGVHFMSVNHVAWEHRWMQTMTDLSPGATHLAQTTIDRLWQVECLTTRTGRSCNQRQRP